MKTKLEMAHEYALEMLKRGDPDWKIATEAWNLADAMWVENNERENSDNQDLSQEECQPNWSQAPSWAKWWAMDEDGECFYFENKPKITSVTWIPFNARIIDKAPIFGYAGNWKDSLRERPE